MPKEFAYTVRGIWPFPLDMLRHDGSRPAAPEDQEKIARYSADYAPDGDVFDPVEINLIGPHRPNTARWESFTWSVPTDAEHALTKRWREEERERRLLRDQALAKLTIREREALEWHFQKAV